MAIGIDALRIRTPRIKTTLVMHRMVSSEGIPAVHACDVYFTCTAKVTCACTFELEMKPTRNPSETSSAPSDSELLCCFVCEERFQDFALKGILVPEHCIRAVLEGQAQVWLNVYGGAGGVLDCHLQQHFESQLVEVFFM